MTFKQIKNIDDNYFMHTFNRSQRAFERGEGCTLYDTEGRAYTDFFAGIAVSALGYAHPELTAAVADQAGKLLHLSNLFYSSVQAEALKTLMQGTDFNRAFFSNSGAEANECAIKIVRKHFHARGGKRYKIIAADNSFHGRTVTTAAATGQPKYSAAYAPLTPGFVHVPFNDCAALTAAAADEEAAAILLENIQGESGVYPATYEFINTAYVLCKSKGLFLIFDEVQTGVGRTGKFFGYEHYDIIPDIVTLAKGLAGGIPIGATLARGDAAEAFAPGDHGSTFGGNPLACRAATVVLKTVRSAGFLDGVAQKGRYLLDRLTELKRFKCVTDARGKGLLAGAQLVGMKNTDVVSAMLDEGFILNACGNNTLRFCPPLIITHAEIDKMIDTLAGVLEKFA